MSRTPILIALCLCLSGCIAAWGSGYHIEGHTKSSITIKFDPIATDLKSVTTVADKYCAQGGLAAVKGAVTVSPYALQTVVFACAPAQPAR